MLKIRLTRIGKKKNPFYRIVVCDSLAPRDGKFIERIGEYNVLHNPPLAKVDKERAVYWLSKGAQVSPAVKNIFTKQGVL
ncbi:MAG: 30S ribosomal protein S16 [Candidatus Omnitrophica bacterium 4484_213]|nr:MAG: 30S ribosomal protein S16 [Candidatus Omnitrophica bacterium 4484_213]